MSGLTKVRKLTRRPVRRSRIVLLTKRNFGIDSLWTQRIVHALDVVTDINRGQKRKNGEARINHERQMFLIYMVYLSGTDPVIALSILLHDLYEENRKEWPLYRIEKEFGREARNVVSAVTKPRMSLAEQVSAEGSLRVANRIQKGGTRAIIVKLIDRLHFFLKPFPSSDRKKRAWKIVQTMQYIQQMALEVGVLVVELELAVAYSLRKNDITNAEIMEFV